MFSHKASIRAADMMTTSVVTLRADQHTHDAVQTLLKRRISGAPVVDETGRLVGIFSEKDSIHALLRAVHERLPSSLVGDHMTTEVISVTENTSLLTIAHLFLTHTVRRLPVVHGGKLIGIVSRRDLLQAASQVMQAAPTRDAALLYLSVVSDEGVIPIHSQQ